MPLLRSSSRGVLPVDLQVKILQREGEPAIHMPRGNRYVAFAVGKKDTKPATEPAAAGPAAGGPIRSASKKVARQASRSPYSKPAPTQPPQADDPYATAAPRN